MGRRVVSDVILETEATTDDANGEVTNATRPPLTSAQRLAASSSSSTEVAPDPFGREAKHFTEIRVLNRDVSHFPVTGAFCCIICCLSLACSYFWKCQVRIVLEGVDKFSNLIGSVYYPDGDTAKDLALELVQNVWFIFSG